MSKRWTDKELETLTAQLADGVALRTITGIDDRTQPAIAKKANRLGFGTRGAKSNTTVDSASNSLKDISTQSVKETDSESIDPINGLEVNTIVIDMLQENNIPITPKIVYQLSIHIVETQGVQV